MAKLVSDLSKEQMPLLDIGNTSIKLRDAEGDRVIDVAQLQALPFAVVSNVRSARIQLPNHWCQAKVAQEFDGFKVAYAEPEKLGVDRWLTMLAVHDSVAPGEIGMVVDCGTAIKIELFTSQRQLGGFILPGLNAALNGLFGGADQLHRSLDDGLVDPGIQTELTIGRAMPAAVLALIEKMRSEYKVRSLFLTGGDSMRFADYLPSAQCSDNLVLDGLAHWWARQ